MDTNSQTKEQLISHLNEMTKELQSLKEWCKSETTRKEVLEFNLQERMKELNCHNQLSKLLVDSSLTIPEFLDEIVQIIPPAWQFPEFTLVSVDILGYKAQTPGYQKTAFCQTEKILINNRPEGYIEVSLNPERLPDQRIAFLQEERDLLFSVAAKIGKYAEKIEKEKELQENELKYRNLVETIDEIVYEIDSDGKIIFISNSVGKKLGYKSEELTGKSIYDILHNDDKPILASRLQSTELQASTFHEYRFLTTSGEIKWFSKSTASIKERGQQIHRIGTLTDITEKKKSDEALLTLNRLYAVISQVNQMIVYHKQKDTLLEEICRIAIEFGQFRMAWIGLVDHNAKTIRPYIVKGVEGDYLKKIDQLPFYDRPEDRGPTEIAAQEGRTFVCNDIENDPAMIPWKDADLQRGYRSSIALPIKQSNRVVAVYNLYSSEPGFFNADEIKLLEEVAGDISYALDAIETENERKKAEEETKKFRTINDQANFGSAITTAEGIILYVNPAFAKMHQYETNDLIGKHISIFHNAEQMTEVDKSLKLLSEIGEFSAVEIWHTRKDGSVFPTLMNAKIIFDTDHIPQYLSATAIDISEIHQKEAQLRQNEESLNYAQEIGNLGSWEHDFETNILSCSRNYYRQLGLNPDKPHHDLYNYFISLVHPDDLKIVDYLQSANYAENKTEIADLRIVLPDGEVRWLQNNVVPVFKNGKLSGLRGVNIDVTERKKAEEEIRKFRTVIEQANYGSAISTLDGIIIYANKAFAQMHGRTTEEVIGRHLNIFHNPDQMHRVEETIELLRLYGEYSAEEVWHTRKDGSVFPTLMSASIILDAHGIPQYLSATAIDITDLKQKENALIKSENDLNYAQALTHMGSWDLNLVTNEVKWSKNNFNIFGVPYSDEGITNEIFTSMVFPEDFPILDAKLKEMEKTGKEVDFDVRIKTPDGQIKWLHDHVVPIFDGEKLVALRGANLDITEKKLAEEEIKNQNKRLSAIINALPDLIIVMDKSGNTLEYYSNNPEKLMVPEDRVIGTNLAEIFEPELTELHLREITDCIEKQQLVTYEYSVANNGKVMAFEARLAPFGLEKALILTRDITEKKNQDSQIRKLSQAVEQSPVIVVITGIDGSIQYVNQAFTIATGYSYEEAIGQNPRILQSGLTSQNVYQNLWETITAGKQWFGEWINKRKDGQLYWESVSITPILDENGRISNFLAVKQDINDRKKTEQEIREINANLELLIAKRTVELASTNKQLVREIDEKTAIAEALQNKTTELENFFNVALDLLCIADTSGNFIKLNKSWETILGYSVEELEHRQFLEFVHPDDLQNTLDVMSTLSEQNPVLNFINRYRTKDGDYRFIEWRSSPSGKLIYAAARDITERIRTEEEMKQARLIAEQANLAKSEFLSRMSHELRTPMNAILGFAQLLEMGQLNPAQRKGVDHILHGGRHLLDLINEVLDISRIEAGRLSLSPEPVNIKELLLEMTDILHPLAKAREVELKTNDFQASSGFIKADRQRLKQVLLNLINNAVKYNKKGGSVSIKTETIKKVGQGNWIRLSVSDTGIGIRESDLPKLFRPFERIGAEQTEEEGSGLGLAVVKKLMDAMNGVIGAESRHGEGSTFWIELPEAENPVTFNETNNQFLNDEPKVNSGTVLYIEDNRSNVDLIEQILAYQRPNIQLISMSDGKKAVDLAIRYRPNLILLDLNLQGIHGSEVLRTLRNNIQTSHIPVVILSASALPEQIQELKQAGATDYLTKPIDVAGFLNVVDQHFPA